MGPLECPISSRPHVPSRPHTYLCSLVLSSQLWTRLGHSCRFLGHFLWAYSLLFCTLPCNAVSLAASESALFPPPKELLLSGFHIFCNGFYILPCFVTACIGKSSQNQKLRPYIGPDVHLSISSGPALEKTQNRKLYPYFVPRPQNLGQEWWATFQPVAFSSGSTQNFTVEMFSVPPEPGRCQTFSKCSVKTVLLS